MSQTARDRASSRILQVSFFLQNRLGALQEAVSRLEDERVHIYAISILDSADHAVIRMIVDRPAMARTALQDAGYPTFETELLGVALPAGEEFGIRRVLSTLLMGEVNIQYIYSTVVRDQNNSVIALNVGEPDWASKVLQDAGYRLIGQDDIGWTEP